MYKSIIVILGLFAIAQCAFRPSDNFLPASSDGKVTLTFVPGAGYTVPVDFSKNSKATKAMLVGLYTSKTLLTEKCFNFGSYPCDQFDFCERDSKNTYSVNYPHFTAKGNLVNTQTYVDYKYWALAKDAPSMIATSCAGSFTEKVGAGAFGLVGFGFADGNQKSFLNMVSNFAVFFSQKAFRMRFNDDLNFKKNLIAKVRTDANWKIPSISAITIGTLRNQLRGLSAIFDINSDSIGVPTALFTQIVGAMGNFKANCQTNVQTQPICKFAGSITTLPEFKFEIDASTAIRITPAMYAVQAANGQFKLNFRALDSSLKGINYVTSDFANTVILGNTVLGTYYTFFNLNDRSVSLYQVL